MNETTNMHSSETPLVGVLMGSSSDWEVMRNAVQILRDFGVDTFLLSQEHVSLSVHKPEPTYNGFVIANRTVAVHFHEIFTKVFNVVQSVWAVRVTGQLDALPGVQVLIDTLAQCIDTLF